MKLYKIIIASTSLLFLDPIFAKSFFIGDVKELSFVRDGEKRNEFKVLQAQFDHDNITVYKFLDQQKSSYIVFIKDNEENHYIIKQDKGKALKNQFRALCETLCAYIANTLSIPSHHVKLIPIGVPFPGKFMTKRIATIHTMVPGYTIRTLAHNEYSKLDLKQSTDTDLPFEKQGFNDRTIASMALHCQLPCIVALDTFIGNKDRNKANLLYDTVSDSFYVIDMSLMYDAFGEKNSVVKIACQQVINMIEQHKQFNQKELEALSIYRATLQDLVKNFPPQRMNDLLELLITESGLLTAQSQYNEKEVYAFVSAYKRAIKQSYIDIKKLIYLLFILINS